MYKTLGVIAVTALLMNGCSSTPKVKYKPVKKRVSGCSAYPMNATPSGTVLKNGVKVYISEWGHDKSDKSDVGWNQSYPAPCFDDDANRKGSPNATWEGNFYQEGEEICFVANNLYSKYHPSHTLLGGYDVTLVNGTFSDGKNRKILPLFSFSGKPQHRNYKVCEKIIVNKK